MSTQAIDYMNETFRLRQSIQIQGIVFTMFFLAVAIACVSVAFVDEPARYGFKGEYAVAFSVAIGIVFWGGWTLLGVYTLVAYHVERVTVAGTSVTVRSVFQNQQFNTSEVLKLTWKARTHAGRLVFSTSNHRTKLDLYGFSDQ